MEEAHGFHPEGTHHIMLINIFTRQPGNLGKGYGRGQFEPNRKGLLPTPMDSIAQ